MLLSFRLCTFTLSDAAVKVDWPENAASHLPVSVYSANRLDCKDTASTYRPKLQDAHG